MSYVLNGITDNTWECGWCYCVNNIAEINGVWPCGAM